MRISDWSSDVFSSDLDVELKDVFVPDAAISGRRPQGKWHPLFHIISMVAFPLIYSAYVGVAEGARAAAIAAAAKKPQGAELNHVGGEMQNAFATAELAPGAMIDAAEVGMPGPATTDRIMTGRTLAGRSEEHTSELQ